MNGIDYFKMALSRYADYRGRSRRSEYWFYVLFCIVSLVLLSLIEDVLLGSSILVVVGYLILLIPGIALSVRRMHDIGRSGWFLFLRLIPVVGAIIVFVWNCTDSQYGPNQWGPNPKGEGNLDDEFDASAHLVDDADLV